MRACAVPSGQTRSFAQSAVTHSQFLDAGQFGQNHRGRGHFTHRISARACQWSERHQLKIIQRGRPRVPTSIWCVLRSRHSSGRYGANCPRVSATHPYRPARLRRRAPGHSWSTVSTLRPIRQKSRLMEKKISNRSLPVSPEYIR